MDQIPYTPSRHMPIAISIEAKALDTAEEGLLGSGCCVAQLQALHPEEDDEPIVISSFILLMVCGSDALPMTVARAST